jgi:hypothetical protein
LDTSALDLEDPNFTTQAPPQQGTFSAYIYPTETEVANLWKTSWTSIDEDTRNIQGHKNQTLVCKSSTMDMSATSA